MKNRKALLAQWASTIVAISLVVASGVYLWLRLPTLLAQTVSGEIRCSSGSPVAGVWVQVTVGDHSSSGFAMTRIAPDNPAVTLYARTVKARTYVLNVGCGGTKGDWVMTAYSPETNQATLRMVCFDEPTDSRYQTCVLVDATARSDRPTSAQSSRLRSAQLG